MTKISTTNKMSTNNSVNKVKKVKEVKFHEELYFEKKTYYGASISYTDFVTKYIKENPDWNEEFARMVWMELCAEVKVNNTIEYDDGECAEDWDEDDFQDIFAECYLDTAVDKANEKLKKD